MTLCCQAPACNAIGDVLSGCCRLTSAPLVWHGDAQEEPELSLRRTQHYHATSSTQPYGLSQNPLQLMSGMPSFSEPMGLGPILENDVLRAPPSDEAARTTWEAPEAASFTQPTLASLPVDLSLEGQGSNAPGDPTQVPTERVASTVAPVEHGDALDDTIDFRLHPHAVLPTVSAGPAVTPDIGGGVAGGFASQDVADDGTTPPLQVSMPVYSIFNQGRSRRVRHLGLQGTVGGNAHAQQLNAPHQAVMPGMQCSSYVA